MSKIRQILPKTREDKELLEGLRKGDNSVISEIYKTCYPSVSHLITGNKGTEDEAKDIFQEAVMVLYDKVTHENFELSSKLSTFLYAVCRRLWLKQLNKRENSMGTSDSDGLEIADVESDIQSHIEKENDFSKMDSAMSQLGEPCQTILKDFYIRNKSMNEICEKFGYTNTDNAKTQKYKCLQRLKKLFFDQKSD
ncbi:MULTISPECIES: RNA polymerase sigma factor [Sphingobacterium]|uniref:RNA polymerase sigma factor n=1 Tax=Sphingobacterium TaxID=28453 RepID=UPI00162AE523|nr:MULTISPECIES: sigma-70 family RNA polymerase sigma factor [Sphingobacterium]MBV2227649.1 RNA polymerase sigma factor [Sphingobacterium mizutaii]